MLVVPIAKDIIETKDRTRYKVVEYTNYKDGGPAVYARLPKSKDLIVIYFFDIASINGTKVEYQRGTKIFEALGKIDREQQLPQPDDKVVILTNKTDDEDSKEQVEVESLKLKSKTLGHNKGLHLKDTNGNYYRLKQILDLDPALGTSTFDRSKFLTIYKDYTGF